MSRGPDQTTSPDTTPSGGDPDGHIDGPDSADGPDDRAVLADTGFDSGLPLLAACALLAAGAFLLGRRRRRAQF